MFKIVIATAALVMFSTSAFAEFKGLVCFGTEPFWDIDINVTQGTLKYKAPENLKGTVYKMAKPVSAIGMGELTVMVFKGSRSDVSATVLSDQIAGKCSDGMSENEYTFHVVYRKGSEVKYGCCEPKAQD
jgi:uncharacterized membrane protein